ncbi:MAG: hypothetical protein EXQ91_07600 [Alphaproteobacteria bacterium]|nr:hypothetical protein [Alphaproteobacteria bacterium]
MKVLSAQDLADLGAGRGFGFTKAAELNGVPGPAHLLELRVGLGLTPAQTQSIEAIFVAMRTDAVALGQRLIEIEREFGRRFAAGTLGANELRDLLGRIAEVTGVLRYSHLAAHLETPALLTEAQIASYRRLRGYAN